MCSANAASARPERLLHCVYGLNGFAKALQSRVAAVERVRRGKQREVNSRFAAMASHYVFETEFCNRAAGWEKGQIEKKPRAWLLAL